jgi:hypothetical protein
MSYKSQLFPLSSASERPLRLRIDRAWGCSPANLRNACLQDMKFLRSWLVYDSDIQTAPERGRIDWNPIEGLTLAIAVSAGFWASLGMIIAYIWK